jgi:hypothetical protein
MPDQILKEIPTALARELSEYALLQRDIADAFNAFTLWFDKYAGRKYELTPEEQLISLALFRDSIVMFVGCFEANQYVSLSPSEVYSSTNGSLAFFEWLKNIRDSYAAHKFGAFRQCVTGITVDESGAIMGVGRRLQIYAGFVVEGRDDVLSIVKMAGRAVNMKVRELSSQVLAEAKAMSPAQLAALREAKTYDVEPHEVRLSRRRFRRGGA